MAVHSGGQSVCAFDASAYWRRRLRDDPSLTGVGTRPFGATYQRYLYRLKEAAIGRILRAGKVSLDGASVLNVGCGVGYFEPVFARYGASRVVGVDVAGSCIERLAARCPQFVYRVMDIGERLGDVDGGERFDLVTAIDVLYHIVDDGRFDRAMKNICRLCKPDGAILFTESPLGSADHSVPHVRHRRIGCYDRILARLGMRVAARTPMYHFFDRCGAWTRWLARWPNVAFGLMYAVDRSIASQGWRRDANYCALAVRDG